MIKDYKALYSGPLHQRPRSDFEVWYRCMKAIALVLKAAPKMLEQPGPDGPLVGKLKK